MTSGLAVSIHAGAPASRLPCALEVDVGCPLPVGFAGLRRLLRALGDEAPEAIQRMRVERGPEWNCLFPEAPVDARDLFELADAPNQRRLFRESEQTYRVLNAAAHALLDGVRLNGRPLVLRNTSRCDLVSLRGLMHTVELSRLRGTDGALQLCEFGAAPAPGSPAFAPIRAAQRRQLCRRMRAEWLPEAAGPSPALGPGAEPEGLEGAYLAAALDEGAGLERRLAATLLAVRACFFSTNYEGAMLAADAGLRLLAGARRLDEAALSVAWDALDDARLDIPMLEIDRATLGDRGHLRAQLQLQLGVVYAFAGAMEESLAAFEQGLAGGALSPECTADLHMHRAAVLTKQFGRVAEARAGIEAGLAALARTSRERAALPEAWLRNLSALTFVREKKLDEARQQEELALACVDGLPGGSATHLKTNLVSNFSVLAELGGDLPRAIRIWRLFEPLNRELGSDSADKVHAFRLGTLLHRQGEIDAALEAFAASARKADATGDLFNGETLAAALGRVHLERGDRGEAVRWYEAAAEKSLAAGDCLGRAKALAGCALAAGRSGFAAASAALGCDSTGAPGSKDFSATLAGGMASEVLQALPLPRSKMTRPFDLVNL
jgi:tetratricopeptide (TPR) repeat protein